jgi:ferredoxin
MGCGICVSHCESGALILEQSPDKGVPLELSELMEEALFEAGESRPG